MNDQRKPIRFDTKTGQPIYEEPQAQRRPVRYDTTTGQPIYDDAPSYGGQNAYGQGPQNYGGQNTYGQGPQNYGGFDAYGQGAGTRSAKPKKKSPLKPIIIIVAILAVLAGAFFGVRAVLGSAGGPLAKIAKATYNTFKDDEAFMQLQNMNGLISDNTFKMNVKADADGEKFDFVYDQKGTGNSFEQSLTGEIEMYGEKIEFAEYLEKYQITVDVPEYLTQPVTYDFSEKAADPGYIAEQIDEDTLDALDTLLRVALDKLSDPEAAQKEATKIVMDHVKDLEFEKIDKEKIDLGSRKAECGGYEVEIDGDFMQDLWDELMENAMGEDMEEALDAIYEATGEDLSYYMDEDMFSDMPDITLRFYIEKKNLVCIEAEVEDDTAKVTFAD